MNKIKIILWINILLHAWIVLSSAKAITNIFAIWEKATTVAKLFSLGFTLVLAAFSIICVVGLFLKKDWGRRVTFWWNIFLAIGLAGTPISSLIVSFSNRSGNLLGQLINAKNAIAVFIMVPLILLSIVLASHKAKEYFSIKNKT